MALRSRDRLVVASLVLLAWITGTLFTYRALTSSTSSPSLARPAAERDGASAPGGCPDVLVVLGKRLGEDGRPTPVLRRRVLFAAQQTQVCRSDALVVLSGGAGEATAMQELLEDSPQAADIASSRVLLESRSRTTIENALYTRALLEGVFQGQETRQLHLRVITSDFHARRSALVFQTVFQRDFSSSEVVTLRAILPGLSDIGRVSFPNLVLDVASHASDLSADDARREAVFEERVRASFPQDFQRILDGKREIVNPSEIWKPSIAVRSARSISHPLALHSAVSTAA